MANPLWQNLKQLTNPLGYLVELGMDATQTPEGVEPITEEEQKASLTRATDDGSLDYMQYQAKPDMPLDVDPEFWAEREIRKQVKPIRIMEDVELDAILSDPVNPNFNNAANEKRLRSRWAKKSLIENLSDADYLARNSETLADQFMTSVPHIPGDAVTLTGLAMGGTGDLIGSENISEAAVDVMTAGQEYREAIHQEFATRDPQNPLETAASIAGGAVIPIAPGAKIGTGLGRNALEMITPFTIGGGGGRMAANVGAQFGGAEIIREALGHEEDTYRTILDRFYNPEDVKAMDEGLNGGLEAELNVDKPTPDFVTGNMPDGTVVRNSDSNYNMLGLAALGIMAGGPSVRYLSKRVPATALRVNYYKKKLKPIDPRGVNAPKDVLTPVKDRDIFLSHLADPSIGVWNSFARIGLTPERVINEVEVHSAANVQNKIGAGITTGKLRGIDFLYDFNLKVGTIRKAYEGAGADIKTATNEYAHLYELIQRMNQSKTPKNALWGTSRADAKTRLKQLEHDYPEAKKLHDSMVKSNHALIDFLSGGEFAILDKTKAAHYKSSWGGYYRREPDPTYYGDRPYELKDWRINESMPPPPHLNAMEMIQGFNEDMMRTRILNSTRGTFIDWLKTSPDGKKFIKRLPDEPKKLRALLNKHPNWKNKVVTIYRRGKAENYIMDQLYADWLRFDPNIAQHEYMFIPSRVFQFNTTGPGAPWFSFVRFIRDTSMVQVTTPLDYKHLGVYIGNAYIPIPGAAHVHAAAGATEQVFRQAQIGLADMIYKANDGASWRILQSTLGTPAMRGLADRFAASYFRSTYHMLNSFGGFDTSYARNAVKHTAAVKTLTKSLEKLPPELKAVGHAWTNVLDSIQNAATYSVMARNLRKLRKTQAVTPEAVNRLVTKLKPITGDVTVTGKSFVMDDPGTRRAFGVDAGRPEGFTKKALRRSAGAAQFAREANPWFNAMVQSFRRIGVSAWENPVRFTSRLWLSIGIPSVMSYWTAAQMGESESGESYLDYMMTGRSEYTKATSLYIAPFWKPGARPEEGLEIPFALEMAPIGYMFQSGLDYYMRRGGTNFSTMMETIGQNFFGLTMPPLVSAGAGYFGVDIPGTLPGVGESAFMPKPDPYSPMVRTFGETYGVNAELMIRALFGGAAGVHLGWLNSMLDEDDILGAIGSGIKEGAYQVSQRVPVLKTAKRGYTEVNEANWRHYEKLREMEDYYDVHIQNEGKTFTDEPLAPMPGIAAVAEPVNKNGMLKEGTLSLGTRPFIDPTDVIQARVIKLEDGTYAVIPTIKDNMKSMFTKTGKLSMSKDNIKYWKNNNYGVFDSAENATAYMELLDKADPEFLEDPKPGQPTTIPGRAPVPPPKNWIWEVFAERIHEKFETNNAGYKDVVARLGYTTKAVTSLKKLNVGALGEWKQAVENMEPGPTKELFESVDVTDRKEIQRLINIYENERLGVLGRINLLQREVEDEISQKISELVGREVKITLDDLDPSQEAPIPPPDLP